MIHQPEQEKTYKTLSKIFAFPPMYIYALSILPNLMIYPNELNLHVFKKKFYRLISPQKCPIDIGSIIYTIKITPSRSRFSK